MVVYHIACLRYKVDCQEEGKIDVWPVCSLLTHALAFTYTVLCETGQRIMAM